MVASARLVCPVCRAKSQRGMRFCGHCGASLTGAQVVRSVLKAPVGERRLLTVMFCDLVGSTRLSGLIEPEDLRAAMLTYREACSTAIEQFGGTIAQFLGDGVLAYFGYPRTRENDAQRALRAGLRVLSSVDLATAQLAELGLVLPSPLEVRVGVHSGLILVGDLGKGRHSEIAAIVGETTNIAARLQSSAAVGTLLISEETAKLAGSKFDLLDLGARELAGLAGPIRVFQVKAEKSKQEAVNSRSEPVFSLPLFDRRRERLRLRHAWKAAGRGEGGCVLLVADPGMGKTRLAGEFRLKLGKAGRAASLLACYPEDQVSSYRPLLTWVRGELAVTQDATASSVRHALHRALPGARNQKFVAQLTVLLDCGTEEERRTLEQAPRRRKREIVEAFLAFLQTRMVQDEAHLLVLEDLHWADEGTLSFLRALQERCLAGWRLLALITSRPMRKKVDLAAEMLALERLPESDAADMVRALLPADAPQDLVDKIVERTEGVPLFAEEVSRLTTNTSGSTGDIPLTLRGTLAAQMDSLGSAKGFAQIASVVGRSFHKDVLESLVGDEDRAALANALIRLLDARLIEDMPQLGDQPVYSFRHALIWNAAYDSIARDRRRTLHGKIGLVLRETYGGSEKARPEVLAQHFSLAGMGLDAAEQFEAAATRAALRSTHSDAVEHCRAGLKQLASVPPGARQTELECRLQILLATQITAVRGNADPAVQEAFDRARALAEKGGDPRILRRALRGLQTFHLVQGNLEAGLRISERVIQLAQDEQDAGQRIQLHRPHGLTMLYLGRFDEADTHLTTVISLYHPGHHAAQRFEYGSDPLVLARCHLGWAKWFLGHEEEAERECAEAVAYARTLDHPHSLAFALAFQCCLAEFRADAQSARRLAEELVSLADHNEYAYWSAWGQIIKGWASAVLGDAKDGEKLLRRGLAAYEKTGAGLLVPYALLLLAAITESLDRASATRLRETAQQRAARGNMAIWSAWLDRRPGDRFAPRGDG